MKTTAGIMPGLRSIAWANECRRDAKHVWAQPCAADGGRHKVSVLQVQAWQLLFQDQRLSDADTGHRTATGRLKKQWHMGTDTRPPNQSCQPRSWQRSLSGKTRTFKLWNVFIAALEDRYGRRGEENKGEEIKMLSILMLHHAL